MGYSFNYIGLVNRLIKIKIKLKLFFVTKRNKKFSKLVGIDLIQILLYVRIYDIFSSPRDLSVVNTLVTMGWKYDKNMEDRAIEISPKTRIESPINIRSRSRNELPYAT